MEQIALRPSEETKPADTWVLGLQPPDLGAGKLQFKLPVCRTLPQRPSDSYTSSESLLGPGSEDSRCPVFSAYHTVPFRAHIPRTQGGAPPPTTHTPALKKPLPLSMAPRSICRPPHL